MELFRKISEAISGYKTYLCLVALWIATATADGTGLDLTSMVSDPGLVQQELMLALAASFRSALAKITG